MINYLTGQFVHLQLLLIYILILELHIVKIYFNFITPSLLFIKIFIIIRIGFCIYMLLLFNDPTFYLTQIWVRELVDNFVVVEGDQISIHLSFVSNDSLICVLSIYDLLLKLKMFN